MCSFLFVFVANQYRFSI